MTSTCERWRENPEQWPDHPGECASCRKTVSELDRVDRAIAEAAVAPRAPLASRLVESLPVAPWEGASYRPWGLISAIGALLVLLLSISFASAGISPVRGFLGTLTDAWIPLPALLDVTRSLSNILSSAPGGFHWFIGICFVAVNVLFVILLRRPPRGYDATR